MADVISVSALNRYVKGLLDADEALFDVALRGEIANYVCNARSGHCYFSLRDEACSVRAVMFRSDAHRLAFRPEEGMRVVVRCRVTLYERDGAYQIYVSDMFPEGIGEAQLAFEQLRRRLYEEGLFAPEAKKPLPPFPQCIGVVTSKSGAALQDIRHVLSRRWPLVKLLLYPVSVQGFDAAAQIAAAIGALDRSGRADVIIVARGGGSREDLWVFNAENIARAAWRCQTPLISAIGHEIDTTLLDYVADVRAPTPSAAAELAVPDRAEIQRKICSMSENIQDNMQSRLQICYNNLDQCRAGLAAHPASAQAEARLRRLQELRDGLRAAESTASARRQDRLRRTAALAVSLNPYHTLARGYTLVRGENGALVTDLSALQAGQRITVSGARAQARCLVETVEETAFEKSEKL